MGLCGQLPTLDEQIDKLKACVHCGMCLSSCPTYLVTGNEGESPRGRLYMIRDFVESLQDDSLVNISYLDDCLGCHACETACPSGVEYSNILDLAREEYGQTKLNTGLFAWIRKLAFEYILPQRSLLNALRAVMKATFKLLPFLKTFAPAPDLSHEYKEIKTNHTYKATHNFSRVTISSSKDSQSLSLHLGCVMDTFYNHVHWDTIKLLNFLGYDVYIPESSCCGALAYHSGEFKLGEQQLETNVKELTKSNQQLVFNSAGCGAFVKSHSAVETLDIIEVLSQEGNLKRLQESFQTIDEEIVYHPACHLNHAQGLKTEYQDLLKLIPGLKMNHLHEAEVCCGSAGFYNLIKPKLAAEIGERKASNIQKSGATTVVSANPGCLNQIDNHLPDCYQVKHPVSLIFEAVK